MNFCAKEIVALVNERIEHFDILDRSLEAYCYRMDLGPLIPQLLNCQTLTTPIRLKSDVLSAIKHDLRLEGMDWRRVLSGLEADMAYTLMRQRDSSEEESEKLAQHIFDEAMLVTEEMRRWLREDVI